MAFLLEVGNDDLESLELGIELSDVELVVLKVLLCALELASDGLVVGLPVARLAFGLLDPALGVALQLLDLGPCAWQLISGSGDCLG